MEAKRVYFVGIGGIGMAALARYYLSKGYSVAGYDRAPSALTHALEHEGAVISYEDSLEAIPEEFRTPGSALVVYTPAVHPGNVPLDYFNAHQFPVLKRSAVLGLITKGSKGLCFAGTHGKTTTSSMAAHILHNSPVGCNAFLGGILRNYDSNLLLSDTSPYSVIEADEYDRSFHTLMPYIAVITATDPDHLDVYGNEENYLESFAHFTELIRPDGYLIIHEGLKLKPRPAATVKTYTYSRDHGDFHAENVCYGNGTIVFDFVAPDTVIRDVELGVPVEINIENAIAAMAACHLTGQASEECMRCAMATFQGAERRFQFMLKEPGQNGRVIIDDYAHHPDELKTSIRSVRQLYPDRKLTVAFQPHLYSRTRDFAPQFAEALSMADEVVLTDLYPAREAPIPGISSKTIFDLVNCREKSLISKEDFVKTMKNRNFEVLLSLGAGDLSTYLPQLVKELKN
ncbi:MAG: UDP-N-acetylmuramate--L-alanine ligase [Bacteroidales bacterium]|nr:UDP-N-acetylmuramate--L-alanine ligase [Bacteroidales bacterium]